MSEKGGKGGWILLAAVVVVMLAVGLYIWFKPPECSFDSYKRSVGITLGAQVQGKQILKSTLGLSDAQLRNFDSLLKAYGAFYETSCRDQRRGMITKDEYNCQMRNLRTGLFGIESFQAQLEAIAKLSDPAAQRTTAQAALAKFQSLPQGPSLSNCGPILRVNPQELDFKGTQTNQFVTVSNIGYEKLNFSVTEVPRGFLPLPPSHALAAGEQTNVVLARTNETVDPSHPFKFEIVDNGGEQATVTIKVDPENARVYATLAKQAKEAALQQHKTLPTLGVAETVWKRTNSSPATPPAVKALVLAQVLEKAGNRYAAKKSFNNAVAMAPTLHQFNIVLGTAPAVKAH